jgi:hypothetical protein
MYILLFYLQYNWQQYIVGTWTIASVCMLCPLRDTTRVWTSWEERLTMWMIQNCAGTQYSQILSVYIFIFLLFFFFFFFGMWLILWKKKFFFFFFFLGRSPSPPSMPLLRRTTETHLVLPSSCAFRLRNFLWWSHFIKFD